MSIENLCVPCRCRCRHCLLGYDGGVSGAGYRRGKNLAWRIALESPVNFNYYIGFCMDTPELFDYISFCQEIYSPSGRFLQMNGFAERPFQEIEALMGRIRDAGVELIDLTFYGLPDYHDSFAGRAGDFELLLNMLRAAGAVRLPVRISAPITEENAGQLEGLFRLLSQFRTDSIGLYLPHAKGRGRLLEPQRLRSSTLEQLPDSVRAHMPKVRTVTEAQWLREGVFPEPEERSLTLSLSPENIDRYENTSAHDMIRELEALDDAFYAAVPPAAELAGLYGDPAGDKLFRYRDLVLLWTEMYVREHHITLHDMTDERGHFSVRTVNSDLSINGKG